MLRLSPRAPFAFLAVAVIAINAAAATPHVTIRVYDGTVADTAIRDAAIREASAILDHAGADARWQDCTATSGPRRCDPSRGPMDLLVRLMPTSAGVPTASGSALQTRLGEQRLTLGFAVVEPASDAGVLATIFMDRVLELAGRTGVPASAVLGRAIAHEVGHLLLGSRSHGNHGLMRGLWTDAELTANRSEDWLFAPAQRDLLRLRQESLTTPRVR